MTARSSSSVKFRTQYWLTSLLVVVPCFIACGKGGKGSEEPEFEGCPSQTKQVPRLEWGLSENNKQPILAGLLAAIELDHTIGGLEEELTEYCGDLAKMLYAKEKDLEPEEYYLGALADRACSVASVNLTKLKHVAGGKLSIDLGTSLCAAPMDAASDCFAACGKQEALSCSGEIQGSCSGVCTGQCTDEEGGRCNGTCGGMCEGSCDSEFNGMCGGKCEGTCNGQASKEKCDGTCQGRCLDKARGICGGICAGNCAGSCTVEAAGECPGICGGACDTDLKQTRCVGPLALPGDATSCSKSCDGALIQAMHCSAPAVSVTIDAAENEEAADLIKRSLELYLPKILASKALNLEAGQLDRILEASNQAITKMKEAVDRPQDENQPLGDQVKPCLGEKVQVHATASAAIPYILSATDKARALSESSQ